MQRSEALEFMRLETDRDLATRGFVSLAAAQRAAAAYSIVLEASYSAKTRGYKYYVAPARGEVQLTVRKPSGVR